MDKELQNHSVIKCVEKRKCENICAIQFGIGQQEEKKEKRRRIKPAPAFKFDQIQKCDATKARDEENIIKESKTMYNHLERHHKKLALRHD